VLDTCAHLARGDCCGGWSACSPSDTLLEALLLRPETDVKRTHSARHMRPSCQRGLLRRLVADKAQKKLQATQIAVQAGAHQAVNAEKSRPLASAMAARKSSHVTAWPSWRLKYRSMPFLRGGRRASETAQRPSPAAPHILGSAAPGLFCQYFANTAEARHPPPQPGDLSAPPTLYRRQPAKQTCSRCACGGQSMQCRGMAPLLPLWACLKPSTPSSV
jgi:hypothetical protein